MRRLAAVAVAAVLALTACTGGSDDKKGDKGPTLPLPDKAPSARGPAMGPAMEPKVLLAAADDLEELTGDLDTAQVQRKSGAFISGRTVVGYSVDDISGYDLDSGEQKWRAKLDLGGGTVCFVSEPDRAVKTFTVAYGESSYCPSLATIRVSDGKVLKKSDALSDMVEFEGERAGGPVSHLFTVAGRDHLVDNDGVVWRMSKGEPKPVKRLESDSYFQLHPTPKGDILIGSRLSDRGRCRVDGYRLPSFDHLWTEESATLFPKVREDCVITAAPGNSAWLGQEDGSRYHLVQVEPRTGKVLGRADAPKDSGGDAAKGEFDLASASNQLDRALGLPGGDTIFAQVRGLTRYSLETGKVVWDLDLSQFELETTEEFPMSTVLPAGVTKDGYLVASISNNTAVDIVAVDVKTGKLAARWPVPKEYRNGFQVEPGMSLFGGDGIALTRNFEQWEFTFADYRDVEEPKGDRYDIGVFTFPKPDDKAATAVPTAGPVDKDAKGLGGLEKPDGPDAERGIGAFSTGSRLVAYRGNTLTGFDTTSGDKKWTLEADKDPKARICATPEPDKKVKTFTVGVRPAGTKSTCSTVLRVNASTGEVMDRAEVSTAARSVAQIVVHEGAVFVMTDDGTVNKLRDGALVEHARVARVPVGLERAAGDPSLVVGTRAVKGGKDWAIDAYRLPSFERVWSTTGRTVFSKIDPKNYVDTWRGNGLWVSTTFGDYSDPDVPPKDVLALLDPETGKVVTRTRPAERKYERDNPKRFSLQGAITSAGDTVGLDDGDVVLPQSSGVMRYSLAEKKVRWSTDTSSIMESMEKDRKASFVTQHYDLVDGGKTILVTLSNGISVELMTVKASDGKITGRWNVPKKFRNGLQASPDVAAFPGGVALSHSFSSWDYVYRQNERKVPPQQRFDVGLFKLGKK